MSYRLIRWLLRLYPPVFRRRYGEEMTSVWIEQSRGLSTRGRRAVIRHRLRSATDLALGVPAAWLRELRRPRSVASRPTHWGEVMSSVLQDVRLALRGLWRRPSFTIVAVATLALGIGANTAIFTLVNTVLLAPLPYPNADELVRIWSSNPAQERDRYFTSPLSYWEWSERTEAFTGIAAAWPREVTLTDEENRPTRLRTMSVTANWFDILGAPPHLGRTLRADDADIAWGNWVVVLSHGLWQDRFGADTSVVGRAVQIDGQPAEVIGVMAPGTGFPESIDLFTNFRPPLTQSAQYMDVIGRMRPGVDVIRAEDDLDAIARGLAEEFPRFLAGWDVELAPLMDVIVGDIRPALLTLMAATGLVLVIACANVANLLLARTEKRHRELALRSALGANRGRLARQLLTESVVLGALGAAAGLFVGVLGLRALVTLIPSDLPRFESVRLDPAMFAVALGSALVTGVAFGLAPVLQVFRVDLQSELKDSGQRTSSSRRGVRLRDGLVVAQVALAVVVSIGAGLLIKTFDNLQATDPGFRPDDVLTFELNMPVGSYEDLALVGDTYRAILDRLRALPGVEDAGATSSLPLTEPLDYLLQLVAIGEPPPPEGEEPHAWYRQVSPGFFEATGIQLLRGRAFEEHDRRDAPGVVIVNRALARSLFGDGDAVGRRLSGVAGRFGPLGRVLNRETEIVGVVDDVRYGSLRDPAAPSLYFPLQQAPFRRMTVAVRAARPPATVLDGVRREVAAVDPNLPLGNVGTLSDTVDRSIARDRFAMLLVTLFGTLALTLAAVGIYGVLSYSVAERQREFGVRIALGASSGRVMTLVMSRTAVLIGTGVALGIGSAVAATGAIASQLFGVNARDTSTMVTVAAILAVVGAAASYLPAFRATRISPVTALKEE